MGLMDIFSQVGGALNVANSVMDITGFNARRDASLQNKYWKQQFDYAAQYNSPAMQRQRLLEGQYNPALAYGNMTNTQTGSPAGVGQHDYGKGVRELPASIMSMQQIQNLQAQQKNVEADTRLKDQEYQYLTLQNPNRLEGQEQKNTYQGLVNANYQSVVDLQKRGIFLKNAQTQQFISQMPVELKAKVDNINSQIALRLKQGEMINSNIGLNEVKKSNLRSQTILNEARTESEASKQGLMSAQKTATELKASLDDMERQMRQQGTTYSDDAVMRRLQMIADKLQTQGFEALDKLDRFMLELVGSK